MNAVAETAAQAAELESMVTVGHGIAYLFGVVGVVLFVQLVPKFAQGRHGKGSGGPEAAAGVNDGSA